MDILQAIVLTLEDIEVKGSDNMSKLLGCINALNSYIQSEQQSQQSDNSEE